MASKIGPLKYLDRNLATKNMAGILNLQDNLYRHCNFIPAYITSAMIAS